jgi:hypothetical protein
MENRESRQVPERRPGDPEFRAPRAKGDERKEQARQEYIRAGFSPDTFEEDWPAIRSRLASEEIARRSAVVGAEPRDTASTRREGWWGGWIGLVLVIIIVLWLWWIAIWGWGGWGNTGAQGNGGLGGAGQNQPVQQAPQNGGAGGGR